MRTIQLCGEALPHAGHVCAFFDSREKKYETLIPFLKDAIAAGDEVINIVDADDHALHLDTLLQGGVPVRAPLDSGRFNLLTSEETYLQDREDALPRLLGFLDQALERAQTEGHCLRTWGEMNWVARDLLPVEMVLEYEARVNECLTDDECTLLCIYDLALVTPSLMLDILATHPSAIINGRLRRNSHYVEPEEYLGMLRARRS